MFNLTPKTSFMRTSQNILLAYKIIYVQILQDKILNFYWTQHRHKCKQRKVNSEAQ